MVGKVKERLKSIGYECKANDGCNLEFCIGKVSDTIRNECNVREIPEALENIAVDMAVGEFLRTKKTFSPEDLEMLDLSVQVKQIQMGDTNTVFGTGQGSLTPEQRLDAVINHFLNCGKGEFSSFRKLRW